MSIIQFYTAILSCFLLFTGATKAAVQNMNPGGSVTPIFDPNKFFWNQAGKDPWAATLVPKPSTDRSNLPFSVQRPINFTGPGFVHDDIFSSKPITLTFVSTDKVLLLFFPGSGAWPLCLFYDGVEKYLGVTYGHIFHQDGNPLLFLGTGTNCKSAGNIFEGKSIGDFILKSTVSFASIAEEGFAFYSIKNVPQTIKVTQAWGIPLKNATDKNGFDAFCSMVLSNPMTEQQTEALKRDNHCVVDNGTWFCEYKGTDDKYLTARIFYGTTGDTIFGPALSEAFVNACMAHTDIPKKHYVERITNFLKPYGLSQKEVDFLIEKFKTDGTFYTVGQMVFG